LKSARGSDIAWDMTFAKMLWEEIHFWEWKIARPRKELTKKMHILSLVLYRIE